LWRSVTVRITARSHPRALCGCTGAGESGDVPVPVLRRHRCHAHHPHDAPAPEEHEPPSYGLSGEPCGVRLCSGCVGVRSCARACAHVWTRTRTLTE
jgi:hypothetical protein